MRKQIRRMTGALLVLMYLAGAAGAAPAEEMTLVEDPALTEAVAQAEAVVHAETAPAESRRPGERVFPEALLFTQTNTAEKMDGYRLVSVTVPHTAREDVDREITAIVEGMRDEGLPYLKKSSSVTKFNHLEAGAFITRTGDRWMSFLVIGRVTEEREQTWVAMQTRVYNMETGKRILLEDIVREDAWPALEAEVRQQLAALFPEEADEAKLDALCSREGLCSAGMTVSPGHLSLIWRADQLYPEHENCLMRAEIYVPGLYDLLTDKAQAEMDCTGYTMIALTYDDGPRLGSSDKLVNELQLYGGEYTFFIIGTKIRKFPDILPREYDAGFSIQSHTWDHKSTGINRAKAQSGKEKMDQEMARVIGAAPKMMRSPGGQDNLFGKFDLGLPMIRWSINSGDADSKNDNNLNSAKIKLKVLQAEDGDIVLLHDGNPKAGEHTRYYIPALLKRNVMLVTVNDLCALRNVALTPGAEIVSCPPPAEDAAEP